MTQPKAPSQQPTVGPSRDMLGGPWLGIGVFILIAVAMGWGVTKLFEGMDEMSKAFDEFEGHGFDAQDVYVLKQDLLLGYTADGRKVLFPDFNHLPASAQGRKGIPTIEQVQAMSNDERHQADIAGIVPRGTQIQFIDLFIKPIGSDRGADVSVRFRNGPFAKLTPVLGMYLESADTTADESYKTRYAPRVDLFEIIETDGGQVQSEEIEPAVE